MGPTLLNLVACDRISRRPPFTLHGVGRDWRWPPPKLFVWAEVLNPHEKEFTVQAQLWRGTQLVHETEVELVLAGQDYWQQVFAFHPHAALEAKSHRLCLLLDNNVARNITLDFGSPRGWR